MSSCTYGTGASAATVTLKMQDQKMQDQKKEDHISGQENAGLENVGPYDRAGKCRTKL